MTIERDQIERTTSKLFQRLLLTSKDIKRTSMQMPHAFSERKSSTSIRGGLKLEKDSGRKSNLVYGKLNW